MAEGHIIVQFVKRQDDDCLWNNWINCLWQKHGYKLFTLLSLSRDALTIDQDCIMKVQKLFGCVQDGVVDRKALGRIIFHNKEAKKQLEDIIHPYVIKKLKEAIDGNQDKDCLFLDIPLLFESHLEYLCDKIIVVYVNETRQLMRLMKRDQIDESYAKTIMSQQISSEVKKNKADIVLDNNGDLQSLYEQIDKMMKGIKDESIINK